MRRRAALRMARCAALHWSCIHSTWGWQIQHKAPDAAATSASNSARWAAFT
jgi:hypothetical protein